MAFQLKEMNKLRILLLVLFFAGCAAANPVSEKAALFQAGHPKIPVPAAPDYSSPSSWIIAESEGNAAADVFYIYPTIFSGEGISFMQVSDPVKRKNASDYSMFNMGLFSGAANRYAPYYRQSSLETFINKTYEEIEPYIYVPCEDTINAFDYYMKHYNKGKPFFLAGFSQGAVMEECLMKYRFNDKKILSRFIAAYLLGYGIASEKIKKYPWIKQAAGEKDTGVFISLNTHLPGAVPMIVMPPGSVSNNPISWRPDAAPANMKDYKGALILKDMAAGTAEEDPAPFTSVRISSVTGGIELGGVKEEYKKKALKVFGDKYMHTYDFMFFYNNLSENIHKRLEAFIASR